MKSFIYISLTWSILLLFSACTPTSIDPPEYVYYQDGSGIIGTKGGEVYIADPLSPIRDAVCAIKAGALSQQVNISVKQAPGSISIPGKPDAVIIVVQPSGLVLDSPAIIGMSYRHLSTYNLDGMQIFQYTPATETLTPLTIPNFDQEKMVMYGTTDQLGYFTILQDATQEVSIGTFTDERDQQSYAWVKINTQKWMAENLNFATSSGSWCYNDNDINCTDYGRLYNQTSAASMCPPGWHLPSHEEWITLETALGMTEIDPSPDIWKYQGLVGKKLKSATGWNQNGNGINSFQFNALPAGFRDGDESFAFLGESGRFWTNTSNQDGSWARFLNDTEDGIFWAVRGQNRSYSVRCIEGADESLPGLSTTSANSITGFTAVLGGEVLTAGSSAVTDRGLCWNTTGYPQITDSQVSNGNGLGTFNNQITGLSRQTTYYVRAYAVNSDGIGYGAQETFTTRDEASEIDVITDSRDGKSYGTVQIGNAWWMSENLNLSTGEGSWCYNDLASNCDEYGRLYDWITATTACPAGWSLPADGDWKNLEIALGMSDEEANTEDWRHDGNIATRVKSSTGWSTNGSGIDDSKFSIKPGGFRDGNGIYQYLTEEARLWTSTRDSNGDPWVRYLEYNNSGIYRKVRGISRGFSVRCIKR